MKRFNTLVASFISATLLCSCAIESNIKEMNLEPIKLPEQHSSLIYSELIKELSSGSHSELENELQKWKSVNSLVGAIIRIEEFGVCDPVLCNVENNKQWLRTNIYGESDLAGTIFLDYRCNLDSSSLKLIHGHNMKNGSMFGGLPNLLKLTSCSEAPILELFTDNGLEKYRVFSVMSVDSKKETIPVLQVASYSELKELGDDLLSRSQVPGGYIDSLDFLVLNTCWYGESGTERNLHCIVSACRI